MNRLNGTLAAATLVLAGITVHYAHALSVQRTRPSIGPVVSNSPDAQPTAASDRTSATTRAEYSAVKDEADASRKLNTRFEPENVALQRLRLEELRDPRLRALRRRELVELFESNFASVAPEIGMSPDELLRFAQARAEQTLERLKRTAECQLDADCDVLASRQAEIRQQEDDLLGPEKAARLKAFKAAFFERNLVYALRKSLPASSALGAAQAAKLTLALSEATQKFDAEAEQHGQIVHNHAGWAAVELHTASRPGSPDEMQQLEESAKRYNQRLRDVASTMLTPPQLAEFKAIQDRALADHMRWMREEVLAAAARRDSRP